MQGVTEEVSQTGQERLDRALAAYLDRTEFTATLEIASAGEAGSAGKTTSAVTFVSMLAQMGFDVELMDLDGQGNASKHLGIGVSPYPDDKLLDPAGDYPPPLVLGDALLERKALFPGDSEERVITLNDIRRCAYNESGIPGYGVITDDEDAIEWLKRIHVYPNGPSYISGAQRDFYQDEADLSSDPFAGMVLSGKMDDVNTAPHFRIYDLHGTKSISMMSALVRVQRVFNCVLLDDKTTGVDLDHLKQTIAGMTKLNKKLALAMILPCRVKAASQRGLHGREMLARLRERHGPLVADVEIREAVTVSEAYAAREPLPLWVSRDPVMDDYREALAWALDSGMLDPPGQPR